ncbi:carboxypeptidase regulatory-like domain-containing protein [Tautonia plasticadhaerens]|uniref:carboxypeptidase regulatory-like domain-containing protein n=1 Tax=Tautonia plasticadhaerens TaxID=2527974 RepID=UPI0011A23CA3|nr:carboxypeptidase regulatory-like domain-containing protein [Tautonia plasticadhaerens]
MTRVVVAAVMMGLVGCGSARDDGRVAVTGQVLLDGSPLDEAYVTLIPEASGPAVTGPVEDGEFRIPRSEGPAPGPYRVEIDAVRPTGRIIEHPDLLGETAEETANIVPPQFNRHSTLRVEVVADGDNRFEFAVTTR